MSPGAPSPRRARLPPSRRFFSPAASVHVPRPLGGRGSRRAAHSPRRSSRPLSCVIAIFLPLGLSVDRAGGAAVVWMAVVVRLGRSLALPRFCGSAGASPSRGFVRLGRSLALPGCGARCPESLNETTAESSSRKSARSDQRRRRRNWQSPRVSTSVAAAPAEAACS